MLTIAMTALLITTVLTRICMRKKTILIMMMTMLTMMTVMTIMTMMTIDG